MSDVSYLEFADIDWEDIIETLEGEKCIVFLGPEAYTAPGNIPLEEGLNEWLDAENPDHPHIAARYPDGFLQFRKNRKSYIRKVSGRIREFYNRPFPESEDRFSLLAELPFTMFFSMVPDNLLARVFDRKGLAYQPGYYSFHRVSPSENLHASAERPLIFNILGNVEDPESLVLTQNDFYEYLEQVVAGKNQVESVLRELENAERFVFLGLPYDKWHFQLLMRVLAMHTEKMGSIERLGMKKFDDTRLHTLFNADFRIDFVPDSIDRFLAELHQQCEAKDMLRKGAPPDPRLADMPDPDIATVRNLLRDLDIDEGLLHLEVFLDRRKPASLSLIEEHLLIRNRYRLLKNRMRQSLITDADAVVEENQIIQSTLQLLNRTAKKFPG